MITDTPNSDGSIFDIGLFLEAVRDPNGSGIAPPESSSGHGRGVCSDGLIHVGARRRRVQIILLVVAIENPLFDIS